MSRTHKLIGMLATLAFVAALMTTPALAGVQQAITEPATNVTSTKAELHGQAKGAWSGPEFYYAFQYGKTTEYGEVTPTRTVKGKTSAYVAEQLSGLDPNTKYHYRLAVLAISGPYESGGLAVGKDMTFTTAPLPSFRAVQLGFNSFVPTGEENPEQPLVFDLSNSFKILCPSATFPGDATWATTELSLGGEISGCHFSDEDEAEEDYTFVRMNSCKFAFGVDKAGPPYVGELAIDCDEAGDAIEVESQGLCTLKIGAQSPESDISYENQGEGSGASVEAGFSASGLSYSKSGTFCFLFAGELDLSGNASIDAADSVTMAARGLQIQGLAE